MVEIVKHNLEERKEMYAHNNKEELLRMLNARYSLHTKEELVEIIAQDEWVFSPNACSDNANNCKLVDYSNLNKVIYNGKDL